MPKIKFSATFIRDLKPQDKPVEYYDEGRKKGEGVFCLKVNPNGTKRWYVFYSIKNKTKRFPLGKYPDLSLVNARKELSKIIAQVNRGEDPQEEKIAYKNSPTMTDLWNEYQKSIANMKSPKASSTVKEECRKWERDLKPYLGNMKVVDVSRKEIAQTLRKKATKAPVSANRLYSLLRIVFTEALDLGWIDNHPMHYMKKPGGAEKARERFLKDEEIRTLWPYFNYLSRNARDIFRLCLLTGQRSGEIMSMRWDDIDEENKVWRQSSNKTRSQHLVPLSEQVIKLLDDRKNGVGYTKKQLWKVSSPWVFPSRHNQKKGAKGEHNTSVAKSRDKLTEWSGINSWNVHDLRRTARTILSRLKIEPHIRERIIGHSQSGIVAVYDMYDYLDDKADGLQKLSDEIYRIIQPTSTD